MKRHDKGFKDDAVRYLMSSGRKLKDVAEELGVDRSSLGYWKRAHLKKLEADTSCGEYTVSDMEEENKRLRKELAEASRNVS